MKGPIIFHSVLRLLGALALGAPLAAQSPEDPPPPSPGELEPERLPTRQPMTAAATAADTATGGIKVI